MTDDCPPLDRQDSFQELRENLPKIVPFIGAGFSVPDCLSWWGFLEAFQQKIRRDYLLDEDLVRLKELADAYKVEAYADLLIASAGRGKTNTLLKSFFGGREVSAALKPRFEALHRTFKGLKITTNFDCLLENTATVAPYIIHGNQPDSLNKALSRDLSNGLLKIHGGIDDPDSIILTSKQYAVAYGHPDTFDDTTPLPKFLARVFQNQSLLFIGCSLHIDRTMRVLESCGTTRPHFALMRYSTDKKKRVALSRRLSKFQIQIIWIEDYDGITTVLNRLGGGEESAATDPALEALKQDLEEMQAAGEDTTAMTRLLKRKKIQGPKLGPGHVLSNRYTLKEIAGKGGFGVVWKAWDRQEKQIVALKVLHGQYAEDRTLRERFFRGARQMQRLSKKGIVTVYEPEAFHDPHHYFVMQYLRGGDFRDAVNSQKYTHQQLLTMVLSVAQTLALAHKQGIIHRDIKPGNIMLDETGKVYLTDFDLVRAKDTTAATRTAMGMGTFLYAAPEQHENARDADHRCDIYGLGMTAVFALYGQKLTMPVIRETQAFLDGLSIDPKLREVLAKAIHYQKELRYQQMESFATDLQECLDNKDVEPPKGPQLGSSIELVVGGVIQVFRGIPPGTFLMGSPKDEPERFGVERQHQVTLTRGFWMADTASTQALWTEVMGENPSLFKGKQRPVEQVSWLDIQTFLDKLNERFPDWHLRLPTEAEWEYACRAGTQTPFSFGTQITPEQVNHDGNYPYAGGGKGSYRKETVAVKSLPGNPWGLYEMHGNVWEWCADWYDFYAEDDQVDPTGPIGDEFRVLRGGSWGSHGRRVRSAYRDFYGPDYHDHEIGFRLVSDKKSI